jgi:dihydrofolate reductase
MATTVLYMSMSVDGFIAGPNVRPDNGLGDRGERLHQWVFGEGPVVEPAQDQLSGVDREMWDEMLATRAVIAGRGTFEPAGGWDGDHHGGVPIFILSRHPAPAEFAGMPLVTYLADLDDLVQRARAAAGDGSILVHGAGLAQRLLAAGELDEIQLHVVPVLLGAGRPLFEGLEPEHIELEPLRSEQGAEVLHVRYRVRRPAG